MDPADMGKQLADWREQTARTHEMISQVAMKQIEIASKSIAAHYEKMLEIQEKLLTSSILQYEKLIDLEERAARAKGGAGSAGSSS